MFLKRSRVKKPGQEVFKSEPSEYIKAEELYIGARVNVNGYLFHLLNADKYTLRYMEENSDKVSPRIIVASPLRAVSSSRFFLPWARAASSCRGFYIVHSHMCA